MRRFLATASTAAILAAAALPALADVKLPAIISDNMCLQAGKQLPIWGTAQPGEKVTVELNGAKADATAGGDGKWMVKLPAQQAGGPLELHVNGSNQLTVKNVVVGEVWVASGQSNMEFGFRGTHNNKEETPKANYPKIRLFNLKKKIAFTPQADCEGKWEECTPETVQNTSAVGYFFAKDIHHALNVPVGLIHTSWGGTPAEAWTRFEDLEANPELKPLAERFATTRDNLAAEKEKYNSVALPKWEEAHRKWEETTGKAWKEATQKWAAEQKAHPTGAPAPKPAQPEPRRPSLPDQNPNLPTVLYNGMIAPIVDYAIAGSIWYQGESNAGNPWQYRTLFPAMINSWRNVWTATNPDEKDFPFAWVQLANFMDRLPNPDQTDGGWPGLREAQSMTLALPKTAQAVIIDVGQANDIHPKDKMDVGHRLALGMLKVAYGKDVVFSGPTFQSLSVEGNKARVKFANVGAGLTIAAAPSTQPGVPQAQPASEVKGFSIAGEDKVFHWATAKIEGDTVVVSSEEVPNPVAVRYAWANNPECNLYNKDGLPASPFRTDKWGGAPAKK